MKFKDFQAPVLFSSTFKDLNVEKKIQVFQGCMGTLYINLNPGCLFVQQPPKKGKGSRGSFTLLC